MELLELNHTHSDVPKLALVSTILQHAAHYTNQHISAEWVRYAIDLIVPYSHWASMNRHWYTATDASPLAHRTKHTALLSLTKVTCGFVSATIPAQRN